MNTTIDDRPPTLRPPRRRIDPYAAGMGLFGFMIAAGFVMIALGKRSLARHTALAAQVPSMVSGCVAGLTLVAVGAGLAVVFHSRRCDALLRRDHAALIAESSAVVECMLANEDLP